VSSAKPQRSTLLTSPVSQLDFAARLAFFALAPWAIILVAILFPVTGTLLSIAAALIVFVAAETFRGWAGRSRIIRLLVSRELEMANFYRGRPQRPFVYYLFYPLLFPYWLTHHDAKLLPKGAFAAMRQATQD
jgi:hypothetical protein